MKISDEEFKNLYVDKKLTQIAIGQLLNVSKNTVWYHAKRLGLNRGRKVNIYQEPLFNERFRKLIFIKSHKNNGKIMWGCRCDCGNIKIGYWRAIKHGSMASCGCDLAENTFKRCFTGYKDISGKYWAKIKKEASIRNLTFELTKEQIWNLYLKQDKKCALSGMSIVFTPSGYAASSKSQTASIDRINSGIGYTIENIQLVHKDVNWMKHVFPENWFIKICRMVAKTTANTDISQDKNINNYIEKGFRQGNKQLYATTIMQNRPKIDLKE